MDHSLSLNCIQVIEQHEYFHENKCIRVRHLISCSQYNPFVEKSQFIQTQLMNCMLKVIHLTEKVMLSLKKYAFVRAS